ncbi:segregation and condensation protein B [Bacillus pseudomycoides]|uniref:Segregation and condensation protein B n=2 Tax=Bacillaceae TaxID=186817 RepID=A0AA91VBP7_9BACI|nr:MULTISPECIES: SMC-Scp complex subunit ScpB [Bacillus]PEB53159.1 segregation and condensation protein B [Bacillus sp. AFS098217]PED82247.1 segregation and condensation protein B [Bacillus pseudomycoides]PEU13427.1 segregation and condensation protein B [Bacillus sp. AFS014408]PEU14553.1 segregation and condensation protein B [Bacillus sp. AFS019443]PFW61697.1 segregation and condensation protein B [Bacillus sp. AFS075034]
MERKERMAIIEGLLFVAGDEGIYPEQIAKVLEIEVKNVVQMVEEMQKEWEGLQRGLQIVQFAKVYRLVTKKEHALYYQKLMDAPTAASLSQAALETLAIVAYRQPITRTEMEEIRGVKTDRALQTLVSHLLIKEIGRAEGPGRPILYGTTKEFLDTFGLQTLDDLPVLSEENEQMNEADLFFGSLQELSK